jgi:hypothetical protein
VIEILEIAMQGPPGTPGAVGTPGAAGATGNPGPAGSASKGAYVSTTALARGQMVCVSRSTGQVLPADAAVYTQSFVLGFADAPVAAGFAVDVLDGPLQLADWTLLAGTPALVPGTPYFLASGGRISATPPTKPGFAALTLVGTAASTNRLIVNSSAPFLL